MHLTNFDDHKWKCYRRRMIREDWQDEVLGAIRYSRKRQRLHRENLRRLAKRRCK